MIRKISNRFPKLWSVIDGIHFLCFRARPNAQFRRALSSKYSSHPTFNQHAQQLVDNGILILPSYFYGDTLKQMQMDFEKYIPKNPTNPDHPKGYWINKEYMSDSVMLSRAAVDSYLIDLVANYWGKSIYLAEVSGKRLDSCEPYEHGSFQWHHDTVRKQIKVFIFLTKVPEDGQVMEYIPKTHNIVHWDCTRKSSRFNQEKIKRYFEKYPNPINCSCPAGTVVIFDTNGLHRGNRNLGPIRDSWTFNFNDGDRRYLHPIPSLHPEVLACLDKDQKRMVRAHDQE